MKLIFSILFLMLISSCSLTNLGQMQCTEAGCFNTIIVTLPESLILKPDTYIVTTRTNTGKTKNHTFITSNSSSLKTFSFFDDKVKEGLPEIITITIKNSKGMIFLKQSNKVYFDKSKPFFPNGKKCGGACYIANLKLKPT